MASDINQVALVGRLTRDAELRYTASGTAICTFSLAVNRRVKKGDQWQDEVSFFDLTIWDKQAEGLSKYLVKGTQVAVQGELRQERWEKDGQRYSKVQVFVNTIQLLGGKKEGGGSSEQPSYYAAKKTAKAASQKPVEDSFDPNAYEDDIPF